MDKEIKDKIVFVGIENIKPYEGSHNTDSVIDMIVESIKNFGIQQPIILDSNNVIVAGNAIYKAASILDIKEIPCIVLDNLTEDEIAQYRIADNKTSEFARWNERKLRQELSYLSSPTELQFCFDEDIKRMIGLDEAFIPRVKEKELTQEQAEQIETKKDLAFKEQLKVVDKELEAKPREYLEYFCSKCGRKVIIKL